MLNEVQLDIVSAEGSIFSGSVKKVTVTGQEGVLEIFPGHMALLTPLEPGYVRTMLHSTHTKMFYISGGFLEIQPQTVTVLADTAIHAENLDQQAALQAKERAEQVLQGKIAPSKEAKKELALALAQLRVIRMLHHYN
jgi:F-type H+-transporting ATPase subunit epsilon